MGDESWVSRYGEEPGPDTSEAERIRVHLAFVEQLLRDADVSGLTSEQQANRAQALDALARYIEAGEFPRRTSDEYEGRRPRFIDDRGVHCAVGEMIRATGEPALAAELDRRHEYDYVAQMSDEPLLAWAERFGFTPLELAMIQPTYGRPPSRRQLKQDARGRVQGKIERDISAATLMCSAVHEPVGSFRIRAGVHRSGEATVDSPRRAPFVQCILEELRRKSRTWERKPWSYHLRMTLHLPTPQEILEERMETLALNLRQLSCPNSEIALRSVDLHVRFSPQGNLVEARTATRNAAFEQCVADYVEQALFAFDVGGWTIEHRTTRVIDDGPEPEPREDHAPLRYREWP